VATAKGAAADMLDKTQLLAALTALKKGDFSVRLPIDLRPSTARSPTPSTTSSS
jgi:hypothetical protein